MHLTKLMGRSFFIHSSLVLAGLLLGQPLHAEEDVLGGVAGIINAVSPIAVAGIQAGADKALSSINAGTEVRKTEIAADVARDTNRTNAIIELNKTKTAAEINAINQEGLTERQALVTTEKIIATKEMYASQREQNWMDYEYNIARLLADDKARTQQLALEKQSRDLQTSIAILTPGGINGGLNITRVNTLPERVDPNPVVTTNSALAAVGEAASGLTNSAQSRLTRGVASTKVTMAEKLSGFRASNSTAAVASLPQLVATANTVERNTPMVRGSSNGKLLAAAETATDTSSSTIARGFASRRPGVVGSGVGHGTIGRQSANPTYASGDSGGGETSLGHHAQP